MPRPKKRRGKFDEVREQKKAAKSDNGRENAKRRKLEDGQAAEVGHQPGGEESYFFEDTTPGLGVIDENLEQKKDEMVYYGLLDDDEQAYYANVNTKLTANDFEDAEEKTAFVDAVYRESRGKEMKLASSQSCSRHLERIMKASNADQLRGFFEAIMEGMIQLMQHRFGSHVCETLFLECAKYVSAREKSESDESETSVNGLYLQAASQLQEHIGYMVTDKFASHTIRVLLLVLSGEPLEDGSIKSLLASKKKEQIDTSTQITEVAEKRKVPKAFLKAMSSLTTAAVSSLDVTYLRALATHPTGNPVLQLLLRLELINSDRGRDLSEGSLFNRLVDPANLSGDSEGGKFVSGLTYDSTGSRLIEVLVDYSPGKVFKKLYKGIWKDKMQSMAKNDIANYVAIKILERIGKEDLMEARRVILQDLSILMERKRFMLLKALVDRSKVREIELQSMSHAFKSLHTKTGLLDACFYPGAKQIDKTESSAVKADMHGSLLAQSMLEAESVGDLVREALSELRTEELRSIAIEPAASRVLQLALTASITPMGFRRRMIPKFYGTVVELAKDAVGSYVADALWQATNGLNFMKERLARELADHESELRDSYSGRKVWKNWSMDLYTRRRGEWQALAKGFGEENGEGKVNKTPIELARQRRAEEKARAQQHQDSSGPLVSANA